MKLFTQEYFDELVNRINNDEEFQKKSSKLNLDVLMVCKDRDASFHLKFENGKASGAAAGPDATATFAFIGNYAEWMSNHNGEASLEKMMMMGKIKFKGPMAKILGVRAQLTMVDNLSQGIPVEEE